MLDNSMMLGLKKFITDELDRNIKTSFDIKTIQHNHPPLRFMVDGCEYCKKYGNIFSI